MAMQQQPTTSSYLKIIVGSNTSSSEESSASDATSTTNVTDDMSSSERIREEDEGHHRGVVVGDATMEDVLPTYVLQPKEISKNIDLMKTVAMLMESKLQQPLKGLDTEKMRDLYSDIQRFPEAYQKFTSIIHQIQYLNVTANWNVSGEVEEIKANNILTKFFQSTKLKSDNNELDSRKRIMFNLLNELLRVFGRYQVIHDTLEERLKSFANVIVKKSIQPDRSSETPNNVAPAQPTVDYSDEDDPQQPLLNRIADANCSERKMYIDLLEKAEILAESLRKARRHGTEVHDSIEVLRDLINWDHKQVTIKSDSSVSTHQDGEYYGESYQQSSSQVPEVEIHQRNNHRCCRNETSGISRNGKVWIVSAILLTILILLLIITAALSFLQFNY